MDQDGERFSPPSRQGISRNLILSLNDLRLLRKTQPSVPAQCCLPYLLLSATVTESAASLPCMDVRKSFVALQTKVRLIRFFSIGGRRTKPERSPIHSQTTVIPQRVPACHGPWHTMNPDCREKHGCGHRYMGWISRECAVMFTVQPSSSPSHAVF